MKWMIKLPTQIRIPPGVRMDNLAVGNLGAYFIKEVINSSLANSPLN